MGFQRGVNGLQSYEEKKFVMRVGNMPLYRFLYSKKRLSQKILDWDDSAGEKAFRKAKRRYFAEINGSPSKKDLPWPTYSETKDWIDAQTDLEELYKDWDRPDSFFVDDYVEVGVIHQGYNMDDTVVATGWDEDEDPIKQGPLRSLMKPIISSA